MCRSVGWLVYAEGSRGRHETGFRMPVVRVVSMKSDNGVRELIAQVQRSGCRDD